MSKTRFIFLAALLFIGTSVAAQSVKVSGYVRDRNLGTGISGVVISDGYTVTTTNAKGMYSIMTHPSAVFIFMSTPGGYMIPHEDGLPMFYIKMAAGNKYDFILEKEQNGDDRHLLIVGADPQPMTVEDGAKWLSFAQQNFRAVTDRYKNIPKIGIMCGDIVGDSPGLYPNHKQALKAIGIPFFQVIGNHDVDYDGRSDDRSQKTFREAFGPEYYSFNRGRIHYIVLDDVFYLGKHYTYTGYLTEAQFAWLEKDLAHVPKGRTVVVSVHIPFEIDQSPLPGVTINEKHTDVGLSNRAHLYKLLAPYKVHFMSGHTHWNQQFQTANGFHHIHGAMCGQWWQSPASSDGSPLGFGVYEVNGDSLSWYYQSAGESPDYQMRVYQPDSSGGFIANIWNWDAGWKVTWLEDGVPSGDMKQFIGHDPFISRYNDSLPHSWSWVRPTLTRHLFEGHIKPGTKAIAVRAVDRFGKIYTSHLSVQKR